MGILDYLLKSQVILLILYLFYALFLHKRISFALSRFYLLGIFLFSCTLPLIDIPVGNDSLGVVNAYLPQIEIAVTAGELPFLRSGFSWSSVLMGVYLAGVLWGLARLSVQVLKGRVELRRGRCVTVEGARVWVVTEGGAAFSWFGRIVIGEKHLGNPDVCQIIRHEEWHGSLRHSFDLLFVAFQKTFFWFNPMLWHLEKSLREIQEYQVDEKMLLSGADPYRYAVLLLNFEAEPSALSLATRFSYMTLKDRIRMMATKRSFKANYRLFYLLLLLPALLFLFCVIPGKPLLASEVPSEEMAVREVQAIPFSACPVKPGFRGGDQNLFTRWVFEQIQYPESEKRRKIQGRVTLQFTVQKEGYVSDVKVLKGVSKALDEEAVRVISASPKWEPGRDMSGNPVDVRYTFPVIFQLI